MTASYQETLSQIERLREIGLKELASAREVSQLEKWRVHYLGRRSELTQILRGLVSLDEEARRVVGSRANEVKSALLKTCEERKNKLEEDQLGLYLGKGALDVTLPGRTVPLGRLHPTTQVLHEICDIFVSMGFQIVEGPEVELDYYNFEALNIPKGHPARDMWATLWLDSQDEKGERSMLLRTHTSPMQVRIMEKTQPPVRVVVPGKVYRYEATDATHEAMFHQVEGLAVDRDISLADLKGCLFEFARRFFGEGRKIRFRCDYFPFVEPGVEMAIDCHSCRGEGCRICSGSGWLEVLGAGMVHPEVLKKVGYDPEVYSGFAFGMGVERMPMLKYGIEDIRLFYSNDLRFLEQF